MKRWYFDKYSEFNTLEAQILFRIKNEMQMDIKKHEKEMGVI